MSYRIEIFETTGISTIRTVLYEGEFTVEDWGHRINAPARMSFNMHRSHTKATDENLRKFRRARLLRWNGSTFAPEWLGYIEADKYIGARRHVICAGTLQFFTKRHTGAAEVFNGAGSTEAFGLLTDTNTNDGVTGVSAGTGGVSSTRDLTLDSVDILSAWEELAMAHDAEFEINTDSQLNFVSSLGTDKSSLVTLVYRKDGQPGTNLDEIEFGEDARDMANKIIGYNSAGLTSEYTHPDSPSEYGDSTNDLILIERKLFESANDQPTLDALTEAYGKQRAYPITDFRLIPSLESKKFNPVTGERVLSGIEFGDVSVGDLVSVEIVTPNRTIEAVKRVVEVFVTVDENGKETPRYTLSEAGVFVTASMLNAAELRDVKRRISLVESLL